MMNKFESSKIIDKKKIKLKCQKYKDNNKKIVFTNGCFDVLHPGHIYYLDKAKNYGDILIVGINNDESVKRLKGKDRPLNNIYYRMYMLAALEVVDIIVPFNEDTPIDLISKILPSVLLKGGDYKKEDIVGADLVKSYGGLVSTINFLDGYSSTSIINKR